MRRLVFLSFLTLASVAAAEDKDVKSRKAAKDEDIGGSKKKTEIAPDKSLAGDVTRKKKTEEVAPALQYDQFRLGVEAQVSEKRKAQIDDLEKLLKLAPNDPQETPKLLFRVGELYWEESKAFFFEANRKDDDFIRAQAAKDKAGMDRAKQEKDQILEQSKAQAKIAVERYARIVQEFKDFPRTDEVLYFLGQNLMESGDEKRGLLAYKRLIDKYPKSKYLPDAYLAFGEYYFNNSKGKHDQLEKALDNYKNAAKYPDSTAYGYAIYKQGWCYFNMSDYENAMDRFRAVVLYGKLAGEKEVESGKGNKKGLVKEARNDFVRAYERLASSSPSDGRERFSKLVDTPEELRDLMKKLANLYYEDGKDKEAALSFNMLIKERPTSPESPGFQGKIIDCVMRAGNKQQTINQVHQLVKLTGEVLKANPKWKEDPKIKSQLDEAQELSERTLSNLAVNWHNEGKKTRDEQTFTFANEVYADYLTLYPESPKAYDLRFFWAELLNDNLNNYDKSAEQYTITFQYDIKRIDKCTGAAPQAEEKPAEGENKDSESGPPPEEKKDEKADKKKGAKGLCKWMKNSSYNAILANQEVVKAWEQKNKAPAITDPTKSVEIPPVKKELIAACERYLKYIPNPEKKVEIAYKVAKIYYDYNHLDEAVPRLADIAQKYPTYKFENGDKVGVISANLVLDSYNLLGDWAKVNEWARKFYGTDQLFVGHDRDELAKLIEQSSFKLVNQYEAQKLYSKAADAYMGFVNEFPRSELADKALYNASIDYYNAHALDKAIETRKQLIKAYPKSQYVPQTLYALAEGYDATAEFADAADYYESYFSHYEKANGCGKKGPTVAKKAAPPPAKKKGKGDKEEKSSESEGPKGEQTWEESKAQIALFNAGVFRDGLGDYGRALKNREKYLDCWGEAKGMEKDAEAVFVSIVDLHERNGAFTKAQKQLEEHEKRYASKDPSKLLADEGRIATIYEEKLKNPHGAQKIYERILDYHSKLTKKQKDALEIAALDAVGRAHFVHQEPEWKKYLAVKLKWSKLVNVGELKNSIKDKSKALADIQKTYTVTVGFKSADPAICALNRIGDAYENFLDQMNNPPIPKGMTDDLKEEFLLAMKQQIQETGLQQHATEAYVAAVQKSSELDVYNQCTIKALEKLRTKYKPEAYPKMGEEVLELKAPEGKTALAIGNDIVNAIQAIPQMPKDAAAEKQMTATTKEVGKAQGKQVADLDPNNPPQEDAPPPEKKAPEKKSTPTANNKPPPAKEQGEPNDEPL